MKNAWRRLLWFCLWSLPFLVTLGLLLSSAYLEDQVRFRRSVATLVEGDLPSFRSSIEGLKSRPWLRSEVRAGSTLADLLEDSGPIETQGLEGRAFSSYPLKLLMMQVLRSGDPAACLRLARFAEETALLPDAAVYEAAALLEMGEVEQSESVLHRASQREDSWLSRRIAAVLPDLRKSPRTILYDRRNRLLGSYDGRLTLAEGVDPQTVPVSYLEELLSDHPAGSVRLTIDLALSSQVKRALRGVRGSIVLLDPYSGEILASISDARSVRRGDFSALDQMREPASISKLITAAAGLRIGLDVDAEISHMTCRTAERYDGEILYCSYRAGRLEGLNHALAVSCNIAFANLARAIGREALLAELRRFGFDAAPSGPLPYGRILQTRGNDRQLADLSIGLEDTEISPLHAAAIAAIFANGGILHPPTYVNGRNGYLGISAHPVVRRPGTRVLEPEWLPPLWEAMTAVTQQGGTASRVAPESFPVAMKTGTASTPGLGYHTNYVGFGPLPDPRIAFAVRVTNQRTSRAVRGNTLVVTRRLLRILDRTHHITPSELPDFSLTSIQPDREDGVGG